MKNKKSNSALRLAEKLLPHIVIDMAVCFLVFLVLNRYNPLMGFLTSRYSQAMLLIFCVSALAGSVLLIIRQRSDD